MSEFTVGVEEEYQLVDRESGELRSRARAVIASDWTGEIQQEMRQNTVEVQTRPCTSADEVRAELRRLRLQAAVAAESRGLRVVSAGVHPFSHWSAQRYTPSEVYDRIREEYRRLSDTQNIFGMHVHVAVEPEVDRARVLNIVRVYSPYLTALAASSPLMEGEDSGYASYRWILWRRWPRSGVPPRMADEAEFDRLIRSLIETGAIDGPGRLYWDVRPHHQYPTIEFRAADATPRLEDAVSIAALARAIVAAAARGELEESPHPESTVQTFVVENGWRAARYGVGARFVDLGPHGPVALPAAEALSELLQRVGPVAESLGDGPALDGIARILEEGGAAGRMRSAWEQRPDPRALVGWLADETVLGLGLDRRAAQRGTGADG